MKTKLIPLLLGLLSLAGTSQAAQLGTGINYQGRLTDGGSPANGTHSFKYRLVADPNGTTQIGPAVDLPNQNVSGGLFNASLDFGAGAFNGQERWLEISVKTGGPGAAQDYIKLNPQPLPPGGSSQYARISGDVLDGAITGPKLAPLSITSGNLADGAVTAAKLGASSVGSSQIADGSITAADIANNQAVKSLNINGSGNLLRDSVNLAAGANVTLTPNGNTVTISSAGTGGNGIWTPIIGGGTYYNGGNVGIGAINPSRRLEVQGAGDVEIGLKSTDVGGRLWTIQSSGDVAGNLGQFHLIDRTAGAARLSILNDGNVGIGTTDPTVKLDVNGDVTARGYLSLEHNRTFVRGFDGDGFHWFRAGEESDTILAYTVWR